MALEPRSRRDLGVLAGVLAAAALLYPRALAGRESFFERDLCLYWYPRLLALGRALAGGALPLWDPAAGFGQPLLADPAAQVAYPLAWPALLVPLRFAYTLFVVVHLAVAALGSERLARRLGAGRYGSAAAALLFVLSGPLQSSVNLWHHFAGACWMPWVLLCAERALRRPSPAGVARLAATATLQLLAGSADVCAMTWLAAGSWAALRLCVRGGWRRLPRDLAVLAGGGVLALGAGAVIWLPTLDALTRSARRDLPADVRGAWSVPVAGLLRLVAPLDPAHVAFDADTWKRLYDRPELPFLFSLYLGAALLVLAAAPLASRLLRRRAASLLAWAALGVLFAMGPHGPLYGPLAAAVAPLRVFRYPSKTMLAVALALALGAGLGVGWLARARQGRWRWWLAALWLAGAAAAAAGGARFEARATLWPLPALAACGALVLVAPRLDRRLAALVAAAACAADLVSAHAALHATAPPWAVFDPPPLVALVERAQGRRLYVYDYHTLPGTAERLLGRADPYRSASLPGVDPRVSAAVALRSYLLPLSAGLFGLEGSYDFDLLGLYPRDLNDLVFALRRFERTPVHATLLRMGAVGTVVSLHRAGLEPLLLERAVPGLFPEPILVWRVPGALPRAWLVGCTRVADRAEAFRALADPGFDPAREVILPERDGTDAACGPPGSVRIVSFRADRVGLEADSPEGGHLVLADAWDPGWRASVDGRPAPLLRANVGFRAVAVPPGRHAVEMVYRPRTAALGAVVSLVSLLAGLAAWLPDRGRRARAARSTRARAR